MKIEMNTVYHLPTQAHEDDFLKQADKQGVAWSPYLGTGKAPRPRTNGFDHIRVGNNVLAGYDRKPFYKSVYPDLPTIEWKLGFAKADMQIGQPYKMRNEAMGHWDKEDSVDYDDNLKWGVSRNSDYDIVEVYPFSNTPIWKREEPKYRVKTELTKEQAEKLGLEFCEVVE